MTKDNSKSDLVPAAVELIKHVGDGDNLAARNVLNQAAVGLRDVLAGRLPDQERLMYLNFLLSALEEIDGGVPPEKALGLWSNNAPRRIDDLRAFTLFLLVREQLEQPASGGDRVTVESAQKSVAKKKNIGYDTVKDAWEEMGARGAWMALREEEGK